MNTQQLQSILSQDQCTGPIFGGVYSSDCLPKKAPWGKRIFIANTDPSSQPGRHWVAFYFGKDGVCNYFDSYGLPPLRAEFVSFMERNADSWVNNERRVQNPYSTLCGEYCLFFAAHMCRGLKMSQILKLFDDDKRLNDAMVVDFVHNYFNFSRIRENHCGGQSCCSAMANPLLSPY